MGENGANRIKRTRLVQTEKYVIALEAKNGESMKSIVADTVFTVSGLLTESECHQLIERGESIGFEQATVRTDSGPQLRPNTRNNDRAEFTDPALAAELWQRCLPYVPLELEGGKAACLDEHFRFYRYDVGQRFMRHKDGTAQISPTVRSRLSCLFYLNGGFLGGETVFYAHRAIAGERSEAAIVVPQAGDALFFLHEWWHEGRELIEGRKYVLRSDVFYQF